MSNFSLSIGLLGNLNTESDCNCNVWKDLLAVTMVLLVLFGAAFGVALNLYLNLRRCHHSSSHTRSGSFELGAPFACKQALASRPWDASSKTTTLARSRSAPACLVARLHARSVPASQL